MAANNNLADQFRRATEALRKQEKDLRAQTQKDALAAAEIIRDSIRSRIPPNASRSAFPGYAATGNMKNVITVGRVQQQGNTYTASVGAPANTSKKMLAIMGAHEEGATIKPKNGKTLVFKIDGKTIFARKVVIKPKHFFRDGWQEGKAKAADTLKQSQANKI
jgi:Tfp pilus assembly protein PilX